MSTGGVFWDRIGASRVLEEVNYCVLRAFSFAALACLPFAFGRERTVFDQVIWAAATMTHLPLRLEKRYLLRGLVEETAASAAAAAGGEPLWSDI